MSALVGRYTAALRALAVFAVDAGAAQMVFGAHVPNVAAKYLGARDVLRKAAPCGECSGHGAVAYDNHTSEACDGCDGAGWSKASLDAHIAAIERAVAAE